MKKITLGLVALAALSYSTTSAADTPAVREMNSFDHIISVAYKNRALTNNASEFVIYHQDSGRPCPHGKEGKHHEGRHHEGMHHEGHAAKEEGHHHHHHHHKPESKETTRPVHNKKTDENAKPKTDDTTNPGSDK